MRKQFPGHYRPTTDEFRQLWDNAEFALDANVLLNLYRYSPTTRDEFLQVLKSLEKRVWVPFRAAEEFQQVRPREIASQAAQYDSFLKEFSTLRNRLSSDSTHPYVSSGLLERLKAVGKDVEEELSKQREDILSLLRNDSIRDQIDGAIGSRVGERSSSDIKSRLENEGPSRFKRQVPPGYKDAGKDERSKFGDLEIWFQILERARMTKRDQILITGDKKEDWWLTVAGSTISPRPELIEECRSYAGVNLHLYTPDSFLERAQHAMKAEVSASTVLEVREKSIAQEMAASEPASVEFLRAFTEQQRALEAFRSIGFNSDIANAGAAARDLQSQLSLGGEYRNALDAIRQSSEFLNFSRTLRELQPPVLNLPDLRAILSAQRNAIRSVTNTTSRRPRTENDGSPSPEDEDEPEPNEGND